MLRSNATSGYLWKNSGTGHSLMRDPFPAAQSATEPGKGRGGSSVLRRSGLGLNLMTALRTVMPQSKHCPVLERWPSCRVHTWGEHSNGVGAYMCSE